MADVSHELGALRFVVDSPLSSKVAMFNNQAQQCQQSQLLNPFSSVNSGRSSPKPTFSKDEYGKPLAGSLTEMRGQKANMHVLREMLELCQIIDSEGYKVNDEPNMRVIPFGELFNIYNYISDKVVGILLRARKYKYVQFEGEMLFQRRDDDVPIFLLRPIQDIRAEITSKIDDIKRASSPTPPQATSLLMDKGAHQQKLQEAGLVAGGNHRSMKSRSASPANSKSSSRAGSKAPTPTRDDPNGKPPVAPPHIPVEVKSAEPVPEVKPETSTATSEVVTAEPTAATEIVGPTEEPVPSSEAAPESTEASGSNVDASNKTDVSSTGSDFDVTINDLPTIVIEASAVYIPGEQETSSQSTENVAGEAAVTLEPTSST